MTQDSTRAYFYRLSEGVAKHAQAREFAEIDRKALANMDDKELALWQSQHPQDSPQFILAQFEWSRRLTVEQVRSTRWSALVGLLGVILGTVLTIVLTKLLSP